MHYCFVWKKWQWLVSPWMEANLCLNTGGCRVVRGGLSGGRWRGQAVYWELDQWQVNPHWGKLFIFVKAFLLHSHGGPRSARKANDSLNMQRKCYTFKNIFLSPPHPALVRKYLLGLEDLFFFFLGGVWWGLRLWHGSLQGVISACSANIIPPKWEKSMYYLFKVLF